MAGEFKTGPEVADDATAEIAVLLAASAPDKGAPIRDAAVQPGLLFHLARYNKMLGWLPLSPADLPAGCRVLSADLLQAQLRTAQLNKLAISVSAEISAALTRAGLAHVVMKGPFQQWAVHGQTARRPSGDVDLFVSRDDRVTATRIIADLGFEPLEPERAMWWIGFLGEQHFRRPADGAVVDLHHRLQQVGLPDWRRPQGVLARARTHPIQGRDIPVPSAQDGCLLLAITLVKALRGREPCGWAVADLAHWLAALDAPAWNDLAAVARAAGQAETLRLALVLVDACYRLPEPAVALRDAALESLPDRAAAALDRLSADRQRLRNLIFQPWQVPDQALRRRALLAMLSAGRPHVTVGQGLRAGISPIVLAWVGRGGAA